MRRGDTAGMASRTSSAAEAMAKRRLSSLSDDLAEKVKNTTLQGGGASADGLEL